MNDAQRVGGRAHAAVPAALASVPLPDGCGRTVFQSPTRERTSAARSSRRSRSSIAARFRRSTRSSASAATPTAASFDVATVLRASQPAAKPPAKMRMRSMNGRGLQTPRARWKALACLLHYLRRSILQRSMCCDPPQPPGASRSASVRRQATGRNQGWNIFVNSLSATRISAQPCVAPGAAIERAACFGDRHHGATQRNAAGVGDAARTNGP